MKVSDLVNRGQLLPNKVHQERADLFRHHPDGSVEIIPIRLKSLTSGDTTGDLALTDLDSLHIYSTDDVDRKKFVVIDGMVQKPGQYPLYDGMTVGDLIFLAGNFTASAFTLEGELARIDSLGTTSIMTVSLVGAPAGQSLRLHENDRLFVRQIPGYQLHRLVSIEGEVRFPGRYSLTGQTETLWQLLNRAGGFTEQAFPEGLVFKRGAIVADLARKNIQGIMEKSIPLVADSLGALHPAHPIKLDQEDSDRIIIDAEKLLSSDGGQGDFPLQAGDEIYVPEIPSGIPVLGEVCAKGTIKYEVGKKVSYYLDQAGGFTKRADKKEVRLVKANGRVYASGDARGKRVTIGDVIVVPSEIKNDKDWFKFVSTSLSILTGVATTVLIVNKL
jgi:protein involved in polysaccharide export with SLBB domain